MNRRNFLQSTVATGLLPLFPTSLFANTSSGDGLLPLTRSQILGPFYPLEGGNESTVIPESPPNFDLVRVQTSDGLLPRPVGTILHFNGQVLNREGNAIPGAVVELWNTDGNGWYIDPDSVGPADTQRDDNFQGFGSLVASEQGAFSFRTIRPIPYPVGGNNFRASHLHVIVKVNGAIVLTTQLYFQDELTTWLPDDRFHGLLEDPDDLSNITPNLIEGIETIDGEGYLVQTGHLNLVMDIPSTQDSSYPISLSNIRRNEDAKTVTMEITPGCLVEIQASPDLLNWTTIATRQSAIYGEMFPGGLPEKLFYRARPLPLG